MAQTLHFDTLDSDALLSLAGHIVWSLVHTCVTDPLLARRKGLRPEGVSLDDTRGGLLSGLHGHGGWRALGGAPMQALAAAQEGAFEELVREVGDQQRAE